MVNTCAHLKCVLLLPRLTKTCARKTTANNTYLETGKYKHARIHTSNMDVDVEGRHEVSNKRITRQC